MYYAIKGSALGVNIILVLLPVYVLMMALLGLGLGMIISAMTTKYRDCQGARESLASLLSELSIILQRGGRGDGIPGRSSPRLNV